MKTIYLVSLLLLVVRCNNISNNASLGNSSHIYAGDTSVHPILEMGGCYAFLLQKDSIVGLILHDVKKEEDNTYYSFFINGKIFNSIPTMESFEKGGVWGRKIPYGDLSLYSVSFNAFSISETALKPDVSRLSLINRLNLSQKNFVGSQSFLNSLNEVRAQIQLFQYRIQNSKKEDSQFPSYPDEVFPKEKLLLTNNPLEIVQPRTVWRLTKKTAHPRAVEIMKEDWYWAEADDLSPFGNDDGSDAFYSFREWRKAHKTIEPASFLIELENSWGMSFAHKEIVSEEELKQIQKVNPHYRNVDAAIIAVAFGQVVLEGKISDRLRDLGAKAIDRTLLPIGTEGMDKENEIEYRKRLTTMREALQKI
jgi:uncharacterized protein YfeS